MSSMLLSSVILQIRYCDKWQAAWIYESLPIRRPGEVLVGALLAVIVRFLVPTYLLLSASLLAIWGPNILPDILLAFCMTVAIGVLQSILISKKFPFSQAFNVGDDAGRFGKSMFALIIPLTLCGLHYLLTFNLVAELLAIPVALLFCVMLVRRYAATSWAAFAT